MRKKSVSILDIHNFEKQKIGETNLFALFIQLADESSNLSKFRPEIMMRIIATNNNNNKGIAVMAALQIEFQHP